VKIRSVTFNNRRRDFSVRIGAATFRYPYARLPETGPRDRVVAAAVDQEIGGQGFVCALSSGAEAVVLADQVLDYNADPRYLRELVLYELSVAARERLAASSLARREIIRRLGTSPAQLYRLLDQTNTKKSVDQMLSLLSVLDCTVTLKVRSIAAGRRAASSRARTPRRARAGLPSRA
jgi:hypothetical protein